MNGEYNRSWEFQPVPARTYAPSPVIPSACVQVPAFLLTGSTPHRHSPCYSHNAGPFTQVNTSLRCLDLPVSRYIRSQVRMSERWTHSHRHVPLNPFWNVGLGPPSGSSKVRALLTDLHGDLCARARRSPCSSALKSPKRFRCVASFTPSLVLWVAFFGLRIGTTALYL